MDIRRRYFWTGFAVVLVLVGAVLSARLIQGKNDLPDRGNQKVRGPLDAPFHIVDFSDFQCPACRVGAEALQTIENEFPDILRIEFRHYPLEQPHPWALTAALFSECAAEQGKFWEFHDRLFSEQETWTKSKEVPSLLARYAREAGLNMHQLQPCIQNPKTLAEIRRDQSAAEKIGIRSTPTFLINDRQFVGALQLKTQGRAFILEELQKTKSDSPAGG